MANKITRQSHYATANADQRRANIDSAVRAFNAAVNDTTALATKAHDLQATLGQQGPQPPAPAAFEVSEILRTKPNDLIRNVTAWLPGKSPTVRRSQLRVAAMCVAVVGLVGGCIAWGQAENAAEDREREEQLASETTVRTNLPAPIAHDVVHRTTTGRFDGAPTLYVLVDPIDPGVGEFQAEIENLVRTIVGREGGDVSIEVHDSSESLELSWKQYGDGSFGRSRTAEEDALLGRHLVAAFSGGLDSQLYPNTLYWFPAAFADTPIVGPYVDIVEFNP